MFNDPAFSIDLIEYWSSAKLLFSNGQSPYSVQALLEVQSQIYTIKDYEQGVFPIIMWNPPFIFIFIFAFSLINFPSLIYIWFLASILIFLIGITKIIDLLSQYFEVKKITKYILYCSIIAFYPFSLGLFYGQITPILFISYIFFLFSYFNLEDINNKIKNDSYLGGILLSITLIKPHILYLNYLYILVYSFKSRNYKTIVAFFISASFLALFPMIFVKNIWESWYLFISKSPPIYWKTPTIGSFLQEIVIEDKLNLNMHLIRVLPSLFCFPAVLFYLIFKKHDNYNIKTFLLLTPLSLISSSYGWVYDQILLLPTLIFLLIPLIKTNSLYKISNLQKLFGISLFFLAYFSYQIISFSFPSKNGQEYYIISTLLTLIFATFVCYFTKIKNLGGK